MPACQSMESLANECKNEYKKEECVNKKLIEKYSIDCIDENNNRMLSVECEKLWKVLEKQMLPKSRKKK